MENAHRGGWKGILAQWVTLNKRVPIGTIQELGVVDNAKKTNSSKGRV